MPTEAVVITDVQAILDHPRTVTFENVKGPINWTIPIRFTERIGYNPISTNNMNRHIIPPWLEVTEIMAPSLSIKLGQLYMVTCIHNMRDETLYQLNFDLLS